MEVTTMNAMIAAMGAVIGASAPPILSKLLEKPTVLTKAGRRGVFIEKLFRKSPRVVTPTRGVKSDEFFEPYYQNTDIVRISGIALRAIIKYICEAKNGFEKLPKKHLVQVMKRRPVAVKLLLMNPDSEFVKKRLETENNPNIQKNICNNIRLLEELKDRLRASPSEDYWRICGDLDIRMCNRDLPYTIFNSDPRTRRNPGTLYLGLLFPGIQGIHSPLIYMRDVGEQCKLYENCFMHFEFLYREAHSIFHWNSTGLTWYGENIPIY